MGQAKKTNSRLLAELNDIRSLLKKDVFLNSLSFASSIMFIFMILSATAIGIFTSIIHFDATTACVWLTVIGAIGSICSLSFWTVTGDWVGNVTRKLREAEEEYELSTMSDNG